MNENVKDICDEQQRFDHKTKFDVLISCVCSHVLYAAETWTANVADCRQLLAFEMR